MALDKLPTTVVRDLYTNTERQKTMSKITETRKKILTSITSYFENARDHHIAAADETIDEIRELVLDDKNWNEPKETQRDDGEYKSALDVGIDLFDTISGKED